MRDPKEVFRKNVLQKARKAKLSGYGPISRAVGISRQHARDLLKISPSKHATIKTVFKFANALRCGAWELLI